MDAGGGVGGVGTNVEDEGGGVVEEGREGRRWDGGKGRGRGGERGGLWGLWGETGLGVGEIAGEEGSGAEAEGDGVGKVVVGVGVGVRGADGANGDAREEIVGHEGRREKHN